MSSGISVAKVKQLIADGEAVCIEAQRVMKWCPDLEPLDFEIARLIVARAKRLLHAIEAKAQATELAKLKRQLDTCLQDALDEIEGVK